MPIFAMNFGQRMQRPHLDTVQASRLWLRSVVGGESCLISARTERLQALRPIYRSDRIRAMNSGIMALNAAMPLARARAKASACSGARIGTTVDRKASSSAMVSAQTRKNARPCLGGAVDKNAHTAVLTKTISADGGGISSWDDGRSNSSGSGTSHFPQTYSSLERRAKHENKAGINCNNLINLKFPPRHSVRSWHANCHNPCVGEGA